MAEVSSGSTNESDRPYDRLAESNCSLSSIALEVTSKKKKVPRRILHFSDGVLEEYSTDEDEVDGVDSVSRPPVDPVSSKKKKVENLMKSKTLPWLQWCWHHVTGAASKSLAAADYCGEKVAWMLGITSPKYQYALDEYNRQLREEEEERQRQEREQEAERKRQSETFTNMEEALESCYSSTTVIPSTTVNVKTDTAKF